MTFAPASSTGVKSGAYGGSSQYSAPRSGAPGTFTPEQIAQILAVACEDPAADSQRPVSHWTPRELTDEVLKRRLVPAISVRHVGRILEEADLKPHRSRYWLTPRREDEDAFEAQVRTVCATYEQAAASHAQHIHVVSCDKKTGIQALERLHPTLPMQRGEVERREFEYVRHGTQTLIASLEVATG